MSEWGTSLLGDLTFNHDGKRRPVKEADRRPGPYPYYGASGIVDYVDDYLIDGDYLLIAEDGENLRTRQTPIAFMARGKSWVNNHAHIVTGNEKADTRFLMYALQATDVGAYLTGAVMPKLTQGNLNRIPITHPRLLDDQRAIAHILGTLDDKIELNRRMNETLEAMARAIFQSWFVDFDPVRAKASGESADSICQRLGLTPELLALFPDSFEDSELGEIPKGWLPTRLDDVLELAYGKALKATDRIDGAIPVYGSGGVTGYHNEALIDGPTIIVGRKGTVGSLYWEDRSSYPIDTVFYVKPKLELTYCFYLLHTLALDTMNTDAAVPGLNRNNVYRLLTSLPDEKVRGAFDDVAMSVRRQMRANTEELKALSEVRDALLPKLLSGEISTAQMSDRLVKNFQGSDS